MLSCVELEESDKLDELAMFLGLRGLAKDSLSEDVPHVSFQKWEVGDDFQGSSCGIACKLMYISEEEAHITPVFVLSLILPLFNDDATHV